MSSLEFCSLKVRLCVLHPQIFPQNFPGSALGDIFDEDDAASQLLVVCDIIAHELDDFVRANRTCLLLDDECLRYLCASALIVHANDSSVSLREKSALSLRAE